MTESSSQTDFFSSPQSNQDTQPEFAELCNTLYERELLYLAQQGPKQVSLMQRRLAGLTHHVKRAARYLAHNPAPIDVDSHNASWQAKQPSKSPARLHDEAKTYAWYCDYANYGLVVPVRVEQIGGEHIELDSIDRVQSQNHTVHLNKLGWFDFNGQYLDNPKSEYDNLTLCKPSKAIMTSACCGHSWNHKGKTSPRTLSLREMLLSTTLIWPHFRESHPNIL